MKFHFNEAALRHTAQSRLPDREGRLLYRSSKGGYKERWFRLEGNLLFYFRTNEFGAIADNDPVGVFVLAAFAVEIEMMADRPFVFSIAFEGEEGKKHFFSGHSNQQCLEWVDALQRNSYDALRTHFEKLQKQVQRLTGKDPISERLSVAVRQRLRTSRILASSPSDARTKFYLDDGAVSTATGHIVTASNDPAGNGRPVHQTQPLGAHPANQFRPLGVLAPAPLRPSVVWAPTATAPAPGSSSLVLPRQRFDQNAPASRAATVHHRQAPVPPPSKSNKSAGAGAKPTTKWIGKSNAEPQLSSFQKWETFDE